MSSISPEMLDMIAIRGGLATSALDVHPDFFPVLEESVACAEETVAALGITGDISDSVVYFGAVRCSQVLEELAEIDQRQYEAGSGSV